MLEPEATIEIRLSKLQQLFNSFDPSPFHERDLDQDAEEYILDSTDEFPLQMPLKLIVHLPTDQIPPGNTVDLPRAIHNYFAYRLSESRRLPRANVGLPSRSIAIHWRSDDAAAAIDVPSVSVRSIWRVVQRS